MESSYTLMSGLESPAEDNHAGMLTGLCACDQMKSSPAYEPVQNIDNARNGVELRRVTSTEGTARSRPKPSKHLSSTTNFPVSFINPTDLINDTEVSNAEVNAEHVEEAYEIFESEDDKQSEPQLKGEDILTPLTSVPDAKLPGGLKSPIGILKRSAPVSLDGSFSSSITPSSVTSNEGNVYRQGSRRGSKVTFLRGDTTTCATNGGLCGYT